MIRPPGDAGVEATLEIGERRAVLPRGEIPPDRAPTVTIDAERKVATYATAAGDARVAYVVGKGIYLGPRIAGGKIAPPLDEALGALLIEASDDVASSLASDVAAERGDGGVVKMLVDGAAAEGGRWDAIFERLPEPRSAEVRRGLAAALAPGGPPGAARRAVLHVSLAEAARAPTFEARVHELARRSASEASRAGERLGDLRAAAVMVRALAAFDAGRGASLGCELLGAEAPAGDGDVTDRPGREALQDAALIAVAAGGGACEKVPIPSIDEACVSWLRCDGGEPVSPAKESRQDEPLCTKEELAVAVKRELARSAASVIAVEGGTRPSLFAFAALQASGRAPSSIAAAHTRRRYAVSQPASPPCDAVTVGAACHCDEAGMRDETCRRPTSKTISVGLCRFDVDDAKKQITNVVAASPP